MLQFKAPETIKQTKDIKITATITGFKIDHTEIFVSISILQLNNTFQTM
jgi:hypothetical protein